MSYEDNNLNNRFNLDWKDLNDSDDGYNELADDVPFTDETDFDEVYENKELYRRDATTSFLRNEAGTVADALRMSFIMGWQDSQRGKPYREPDELTTKIMIKYRPRIHPQQIHQVYIWGYDNQKLNAKDVDRGKFGAV